jgi:SAM-dependent methyltransferase
MAELGPDGGWTASAEAWIALAKDHDTRVLLLDPALLNELGDVSGLRILDLGCGEGRFSRLLTARGATTVGIDPVQRLLTHARDVGGEHEAYVRGSGDSLSFADQSFDVVVAYLCLIDIPDFRSAIRESARVLRRGGSFVVANMSNIASSSEAPVVDEQGRFLHYAVGRYLEEFPVTLEWAGLRVVNWHRPLSASPASPCAVTWSPRPRTPRYGSNHDSSPGIASRPLTSWSGRSRRPGTRHLGTLVLDGLFERRRDFPVLPSSPLQRPVHTARR